MPRIAVVRGDGIGPEVVEAALEVFPPEYTIVDLDLGAGRYLATGDLLSDEDLALASECDALLLGAVGDPRVPDGVVERGVLLRLRRELDLYVNLRPFPELDLVFVRENTEGLYAGASERTATRALETSINTWSAIERCARYAFDLAERRGGHVTLAHKSNVLTAAGGLWSEVVATVAPEHPQVKLSYVHADAAAYHLVVDPDRFDVILTDNLFGDLLSDVAAGVGDGLGSAASANIHPDPETRPCRCIGLFEPVHGSAPDIAGRGLADPTAAIRAARMLVDSFSQEGVTT